MHNILSVNQKSHTPIDRSPSLVSPHGVAAAIFIFGEGLELVQLVRPCCTSRDSPPANAPLHARICSLECPLSSSIAACPGGYSKLEGRCFRVINGSLPSPRTRAPAPQHALPRIFCFLLLCPPCPTELHNQIRP